MNEKTVEEADKIVLEIEGTPVICNKKELSRNSDYFKAMFEGSFAERNKKIIKLEDVDLNAMNIILSLLWDESYFLKDEDVLCVLQASCMLQFDKIKKICLEKVNEMLSPNNCLRIWQTTEQLDLKPLWLKAKTMAFEEFIFIKDLDCLLELNLKQLFVYLANKNLNPLSEMDVFQACMKWWYENAKSYENNLHETLFTLLTCINYNKLTDSDIKEMKTYPDIKGNCEIVAILDCLLDLRKNSKSDCSEVILNKAKLLASSEDRIYQQYPCFTMKNSIYDHLIKKPKLSNDDLTVVYYDVFKRKRFYSVVEENDQSALTVVYYDTNECKIKKITDISKQKCQSLDGFKLVSYKEFMFMFGGEFLIGKGNWNKNFWVYDSIRERWERKCLMPCKRRHFESCLCGNYLYIIGGTGDFRVIQANMFWYSYKEDKWSCQIVLPCSGRQIKCCEYNKQLFLLNINNKCGYIFDIITSRWITIDICDNDNVIPSFSDKFALFSYKNNIFIKSVNNLIELKIENNKLFVALKVNLQFINCDQMESVLCNKTLFTLYKQKIEDDNGESVECVTLEKFCLETHCSTNIFENVTENTTVDINGEYFHFNTKLKLFAFHHYDFAEKDLFVTSYNF